MAAVTRAADAVLGALARGGARLLIACALVAPLSAQSIELRRLLALPFEELVALRFTRGMR